MKRLLAVLLVACVAVPLANACAGELEEGRQIRAEAKRAFLAEDFDRLEALSKEFRHAKSRTSSGLWKLSIFYQGVADSAQNLAKNDDEAWAILERRAQLWAKSYPQSPSAHIGYALLLEQHAWRIRGGGYANTVPPEAWVGFRHYIQLERDHLLQHKAVASVDPVWFSTMVSVAKDEGWPRPEFESLVNEALRREPYFYPTYFDAMLYLLPRWHGSLADIDQFATDAVARTKSEDGQGMYARIYWYLSQMEFGEQLFPLSLDHWRKMRAGFDDVITRYPDAWNINNYARFACMAGDGKKTRELLQRIGATPLNEVWTPDGLLGRCREWASAR